MTRRSLTPVDGGGEVGKEKEGREEKRGEKRRKREEEKN
jgi:hypothetical protein